MSLISELYFKETNQKVNLKCNESNDLAKLNSMIEHNAYFSDFGTRRRYSYENEDRIIKLFTSKPNNVFVGTSNVHFAHKYVHTGIKVIGTCAHEFIMTIASIYGYKMANKIAMEKWVQTYNGSLGHMLTDTYTTDVFLKSFDMLNSKLFDGCRHDSGDPFEFVDKFVNHYNALGIDPKSKTLIFSDGLDIELATKIKDYCVGKIKCSFGIGTNITNNVLDTNNKNGTYIKPLNMVIKISEVLVDNNWVGAVKLSDNPIKHTGNLDDVELSKKILGIK
jgi:nicotinate phosphoribosyltransferase